MGDLGPGPTIEETARALGAARWIEHRVFELLGAAVPAISDVGAKLFLAEVAPHHAWRAEQLGERLPRAGHVRAEIVTAPPDDGTADRLTAAAGAGPEELLAVVYGDVVPRLLTAYEMQLARSSTVADAAVIRTLRIVLEDLRRDLAAAEPFLVR